jgi:RES domain
MSMISVRVPEPSIDDFRSYSNKVWRIVEAQHRISTNRLAPTRAEQLVLEHLVEAVKPPLPSQAQGLHFLLATPFRYGHVLESRFRKAGEKPGIFYASESVRTAVAELAYWRLRFISRSPELRPPVTTSEHSVFSVSIRVSRALDLSQSPLNAGRDFWTAREVYVPCQDFAQLARALGTQLIRYISVRDPADGMNVALFDPSGFAVQAPTIEQTWHLRFEKAGLTAMAAFPATDHYHFTAAHFGLSA